MRPFDMPSNWLSIHPGIKHRVLVSIMENNKVKAELFGKKLARGKTDYRALFDLVQDILLAPIALAYFLIGRFVLAKLFYADRNCTQCMKCVNNCPIRAINVVDNRPFWTHQCESCMHCMNNCPTDSIQTAHGFVVGLFYLNSTLIMKWGWNYLLRLSDAGFVDVLHKNFLLKFTVDSAICLVFLIFAYRIFHFLLKFKWFERIIYYTSFSSYKFWRRFKGNKIEVR